MDQSTSQRNLDLAGLQALIDLLDADGFTVLGPTVRDGAIVPGRVSRLDDLPRGRGDQQQPGGYRLTTREDDALFGYAADLIGWKSALFPSRELLWRGVGHPGRLRRRGRGRRRGALGEPAVRPPRRPLLRPARDRRSTTACSWNAPTATSATPRAAQERLPRRGQLRGPQRHLLLRLDGHRPAGRGRLRPGAHRAARRRAPFLVRGRQRARRRGPRPAASGAGDASTDARGGRRSRRATAVERDGSTARHDRHPRPALRATPSTRAGTTSPTAA